MKALYLTLQIILLAYAGILLFSDNIILSVLIFLIAFEKFKPLYKEFNGVKILKKLLSSKD